MIKVYIFLGIRSANEPRVGVHQLSLQLEFVILDSIHKFMTFSFDCDS